jgi:CRISPR/Cas system-associated exonuclease Cas4 (RecB family)
MSKEQAWSYSALTAFETCPHRYYETKIAKSIQEPQTEATLWGNRVHKAFELRVGCNTPFTEELKQFEPIAARIIKATDGGARRVAVEQKLALNKDLSGRKWFDKDVWVRGIIDVSIEHGPKLFIGDYKTGKKTPDSAQLRLTAAMMFAIKPWIEQITNTFIWLKTDETTTEKFTRDDIPAIWNEFNPRVQRLQESVNLNKFPKRPSGLCAKWCPVKTCEHNGAYRGPSKG